jgi:hypothetical protein
MVVLLDDDAGRDDAETDRDYRLGPPERGVVEQRAGRR